MIIISFIRATCKGMDMSTERISQHCTVVVKGGRSMITFAVNHGPIDNTTLAIFSSVQLASCPTGLFMFEKLTSLKRLLSSSRH